LIVWLVIKLTRTNISRTVMLGFFTLLPCLVVLSARGTWLGNYSFFFLAESMVLAAAAAFLSSRASARILLSLVLVLHFGLWSYIFSNAFGNWSPAIVPILALTTCIFAE
jgi:hypothetical protein